MTSKGNLMPEEIRVNRPQQPHIQSPSSYQGAQMQEETMDGSTKSSKMPWIVLAIVVVVVIVLGVLFRDKLMNKGASPASVTAGKTSGYQAVFLTNGQVYFGKIGENDNDYMTLTDIFYLQVVTPPLQGSQQTQAAAQQQISLVKLGNELHGPADLMHINRSQILFYEDLKEDGQVVKAIEAYKANPTGQTPAAVPAATAPAAVPAAAPTTQTPAPAK